MKGTKRPLPCHLPAADGAHGGDRDVDMEGRLEKSLGLILGKEKQRDGVWRTGWAGSVRLLPQTKGKAIGTRPLGAQEALQGAYLIQCRGKCVKTFTVHSGVLIGNCRWIPTHASVVHLCYV